MLISQNPQTYRITALQWYPSCFMLLNILPFLCSTVLYSVFSRMMYRLTVVTWIWEVFCTVLGSITLHITIFFIFQQSAEQTTREVKQWLEKGYSGKMWVALKYVLLFVHLCADICEICSESSYLFINTQWNKSTEILKQLCRSYYCLPQFLIYTVTKLKSETCQL